MSFESVNVMNKQDLGCNSSKTVEHGHDALDSRMSCSSDREEGEVEDGEIDDDEEGKVDNNDSASTIDKSPTKPKPHDDDPNSEDDGRIHNSKRHKDRKRRHRKEKRHHHVSHKRHRGSSDDLDVPGRRDHSPSMKKSRRTEGESKRSWDFDRPNLSDEDSGVFGLTSRGTVGGMSSSHRSSSSRVPNNYSSSNSRYSHEYADDGKRGRIRRHRTSSGPREENDKESVDSAPSDDRDSEEQGRMHDIFSDGDDLDLDVAVHERDGSFQRPSHKDQNRQERLGPKTKKKKKPPKAKEYWYGRQRKEDFMRRRENERERKRCRFYMEGRCGKDGEKADHCPFSHDFNPPKKLELCKFYAISSCLKGEYCVYMHEDFPCKFYHTGSRVCKYENKCKFSHDQLTRDTKKVLERFIEERPFIIEDEEPLEEPIEIPDDRKNSLLGSPPLVGQDRGRTRGFGHESSPCDAIRGSSPSMQRNQGPTPPPFAGPHQAPQNVRPQSAQSPQSNVSSTGNMNQHNSETTRHHQTSDSSNRLCNDGINGEKNSITLNQGTMLCKNEEQVIIPLMSISTESLNSTPDKTQSNRKKRRRRRKPNQNQLNNRNISVSPGKHLNINVPSTQTVQVVPNSHRPTASRIITGNVHALASRHQMHQNRMMALVPPRPMGGFSAQSIRPGIRYRPPTQISPVTSEALAAAVALARSLAARVQTNLESCASVSKLSVDSVRENGKFLSLSKKKPYGMNSSPGEQIGGPINNPRPPHPHMSGPMSRRPIGANQGGHMAGPPGGPMMMQNRPQSFSNNPRMGGMMGRPPANMVPPRNMMMSGNMSSHNFGMGIGGSSGRNQMGNDMGGYVDPQLDDLASMLVNSQNKNHEKQQGDGLRGQDDESTSMLKAAGADDSDLDEEGDTLDAMVHRMRKESEEQQRRQQQPMMQQQFPPPIQAPGPMQSRDSMQQRPPFQQYPPGMNPPAPQPQPLLSQQVPPLMPPQPQKLQPQGSMMMGRSDFGMGMGIRSGYNPQQMFNPPSSMQGSNQGMFLGNRPPVSSQPMSFSPTNHNNNDGGMENGAKELYLRIAKQTATGRQEQLAKETERQQKSPAAETPASPPCDTEVNLGPREWKLTPLEVPLKTPYPLMRLPHDLHYSRSDPRLTGQLRLVGSNATTTPPTKPSTPTHSEPSPDPQTACVSNVPSVTSPNITSSPSGSVEMGGRAYTPSMSNVSLGPATKDPRLGRQISSSSVTAPEIPAALLQKPVNDSLTGFKLDIDVDPHPRPPPKMQLSERASNFQNPSDEIKLKINTSGHVAPSIQSPQTDTRSYLLDPRFRRRKASVPPGSTGSAPDSDTSIDGSLSTPEKTSLDSALKKDTTPVPSSGESSPSPLE